MSFPSRRPPFPRVLTLLAAFLAVSCGNRLPAVWPWIRIPFFTGGIGWIVVAEAYTRVKTEPSDESRDIGHLRGGDTLPVLGRERLSASDAIWYKVMYEGREVGYRVPGSFFSRPERRPNARRAVSMMNVFLTWILPPLLGAVIGYVTNALAIKMLFRPLTEKRVFGVRVPFTPGILPRERHTLALSLGDVVSNDLLTKEVLRTRFESPELKESVARSIRSILDNALDSPVSMARSAASGAEPMLAEAVGRHTIRVSASTAFRRAAADAVREALQQVGTLRIADIWAPEGKSLLTEWFRTPGRAEFTSEKVREAISRRLDRAAAEGKSLGDILPLENLSRAAGAAFGAAYPGMVAAVRGFLAREDVRKELERYGGSIVRRAIGRLSPIQRLFVSAAQYEKAILESLPATVADLADAAESFLAAAKTRDRFKTLLLEKIAEAIAAPLASRTGKHPLSPEGLAELARRVIKAVGERKVSAAGGLLDDATLGGLLESLGPEAREGVFEALGTWLAALFSPGPGGIVVGAFATAFAGSLLDGLSDTPVGAAAGWDGDFRERLARYLAEQGTRIAARESERILQSIDLRRVVIEKVDALDMLAIERIMLRVMSKEFKGITWLGDCSAASSGPSRFLSASSNPESPLRSGP
jgi:uncharacterized membrane protein YheB (UPF0754 family)